MAEPPTFLVIGAQKAGTTSLHATLAAHPQIAVPGRKELHYFDRETGYPDVAWYLAQFGTRSPHVRAVGESTPIYCFWPGALERIHHALPRVRLVLLLRDPVWRAVSHHAMEFGRGTDTLALWDALRAEEARLATGDPVSLRCHSYLARGVYHRQIAEVLRWFPPTRLHVATLDALADPTGRALRNLWEFLGVDSEAGPPFVHEFAGTYDRPPDAVVHWLARYFHAHNRLLSTQYGVDVGAWLAP